MGKIKFAMQQQKQQIKTKLKNGDCLIEMCHIIPSSKEYSKKYCVAESQPELGFGVGQSGVCPKHEHIWNGEAFPAKGACICIFTHL